MTWEPQDNINSIGRFLPSIINSKVTIFDSNEWSTVAEYCLHGPYLNNYVIKILLLTLLRELNWAKQTKREKKSLLRWWDLSPTTIGNATSSLSFRYSLDRFPGLYKFIWESNVASSVTNPEAELVTSVRVTLAKVFARRNLECVTSLTSRCIMHHIGARYNWRVPVKIT